MNTPQQMQATVTRKIENHMAAKAIKRKQVIDALGMGYQAFERRMRGELAFTFIEIWKIADVLRADPADILPDDVASHASVAA